MELFNYDFILRAIIVGSLVSLCAALLGVTLVLKRFSMIGDGLSHVGFGALGIALALNMTPLVFSVPIVIIAAFLLLRLSENSKINGDAAIAVISSSALAIGVIAASLAKVNMDINSYMFGSILAMNQSDVTISICLSIAVLALYILFYNKIFAITFDENFASATGTKSGAYKLMLALLTAVTIVVGMRIMGTLLISSLIIFPALTSMRMVKSFRSVIICSAIVSVLCFFFGIMVSYYMNLPAGASVVIVNALVFTITIGMPYLKRS